MKKVLNFISWASFWLTFVIWFMVALFVGAFVCSWLEELLNITGWWCFLMAPVDFVIICAIMLCFVQGLNVIGWKK